MRGLFVRSFGWFRRRFGRLELTAADLEDLDVVVEFTQHQEELSWSESAGGDMAGSRKGTGAGHVGKRLEVVPADQEDSGVFSRESASAVETEDQQLVQTDEGFARSGSGDPESLSEDLASTNAETDRAQILHTGENLHQCEITSGDLEKLVVIDGEFAATSARVKDKEIVRICGKHLPGLGPSKLLL